MAAPFASILHKDTLKTLADTRSYAKGREYYERGRVKALARDRATLTGVVVGETAYAVRLWVKDAGLAYSCSCPQGEGGTFCKHCVALSFAWLAQAGERAQKE